MSTTRRFSRNMDRFSLNNISKATKLQKVVSAVTAMGFVLQPVAALASEITRLDNGAEVKFNNGVGDVWAGTIVDDVTMNVFKKFDVSANDIANMYFKTGKNATNEANNLVNLVFDKINVNGTVNAIHNSKIGGNLFFLSADGLAVSGSGVINAGSLTVMTPTPEHLVQAGLASWANKEAGEISNAFGGKDVDALQKAYLITNWAAIKDMNIPINKMGNITVKGRINTTNGINFKAAHINVSKDTNKTTNPKNISPVLQSGILDFSSMVNTTDDNGQVVNANIQNLTAATAMDGSGDIVLSAVAGSVNYNDENFAVKGVTGYNAVQADVTVGEGAQIIAHQQGEKQGDVKITAEASAGKGQGSLFDIKSKLDDISPDDLIGTMAKTVAMVDINGKVEGEKIDIQANAENKYVNGSISNMNNFAGSLIKSFIPLDSDVNYVVMENKAEVAIGEKAQLVAHAQDKLDIEKKDDEITVKGAALNITADANMKASAGSAAAATKLSLKKGLKNSGNDLGQLVPNAGVTYLETDNQANVSIKGSVQSAGGSNIVAKAEIEAEAAAAADSPSPISKLDSNNFVNAAVTVADIKNSAQVDIASAVEAADALRVDAKSKGSYTTSAAVNAGETSMANTAINITDVNSSAKININGSLKAENIDIAAQNEVENDFSANNSTGLSKIAAKMATKKTTAIGKLLGQAKKKSLKAPKGLEKLGEMFTAGVSVGAINETNKADVTIGKNAAIQATGTGKDEGKLNIAANTNLAGSYVNISGKSSNYKDKTDQQVMVNASVLVSNMDSSANVVIEAGEKDNGQHAVLQGKDISINANSEFTYARPQKLVADLKDLLNDIKSAYEADKAVLDAVEKLLQINQTDGENYFKNPSAAGAMEFFGNLQELADLVNGSAVDANMEGIKAVTSLPGAILSFVDGSKYANFYVASSTAGRDGSTGGKSATLAAAGAVNVNQLANNAQVIVGRNAVIKADGGDVSLNAKAVQQDVTLNGKMKYVVPGVSSAGGGVVAVGGNVGVHYSDVNSVVAVAGGAELAGENINIGAENEVLHIAATYGGGKGGSIGVSGMAAYMEGTSDSIAAVDDKAKLKAQNKVSVTADNSTNIQNIIAEFAKAGGSAAGASVGYVDYKVNNIAAVANIDKDATRAADAEVSDLNMLLNGKLKREALQLGVDDENKGDEVKYTDLTEQLGKDAAGEAGSITAKNVSVAAATTGTIDNITVAGSITGGKTDFGSNQLKLPVNITGAGSASVNIISGNTAALLEDTAVEITATADEKSKGQGAVNVAASDDSMIGAYSGAAALKKQSLTAGKGPGAALAGAVAYNKVENGVIAQLKNVQIKDAKSISNEARKEGAQVAAGLAAELNTSISSGSMSSVNGAANASANEITNKVHAVMDNVITSVAKGDKTDIANVAQDKDIQLAGGITAQYAKSGGLGVGLAASYQDVTNDIQSKIIDSKLDNVGKLQAYAASQLVQVGTAVSIGVQQGQEANGIEGAVAVNNLMNNVGVEITNSTITADSVEAKAFDGSIESTLAGAANTPNTQSTDNTPNTENKHLAGLKEAGFDVDGQDAMDDANGVERDENGKVKTSQGSDVDVDDSKLGTTTKDENDEEKGEDGKEVKDFTATNKGNLIITGATSAAVNLSLQGKATLGAAASTNDIKNNFTTKISGGTLTAGEVKAEAKSDTLMIGLAAGVAASKGQQGVGLAGSASVMQLANKTTASIEKAAINATKTSVNAATSSCLINVTGQVSATKGNVATGLTTATNVLDNTTGAYIYGATIKGKDDSSAAEVDVTAENKSDAYAVALGVAASTNQSGGAANGAVAVNKGVNNTEAIIDAADATRTTITRAGKISVSALDETKMKAISGGVTVSKGYAGVGGAVSYNQIGEDNEKQRVTAQVNNTDITTAAASDINVASTDKSELIAMAAGLAATTGQTGAAAQGSAATTLLHKNNEASMTDTNIDKTAGGKNAQLKLKAESVARGLTSADAAALTKGNAAGSAAVAVTNSKADTQAFITGGNMNLKSGRVEAASDVKLINIGIAAAGTTGQGGSLGGNVAVNNIANDTLASVSGATITATGSLGVLAKSKEQIKNYVGALAATVGQGYAAGGLSTAVNVISGTTSATVSDSVITASGNDDVVDVKQYTKDKEDKLNLTGFVVNADSAHEIDNVVVTAGGAATETFAVGATGTVSVNTIKGATEASVTHTEVNAGGIVGDKADVSVRANDKTEIDSHVGSVAIAASANGGVGVGIASDSNVLSRKVTAKLAGGTDRKTVNADKLTVNAFNKQDITSSTTGVAVGAGAYAGVGVAGTISVVKNDAVMMAAIDNITGKNNGFTVNADRVNKLVTISNAAALGGAIGGASVGAGVTVVQDDSKTQAALQNSELDHYGQNAEDSVTAHNDTELTSSTASGAASISMGAGVSDVITINNIDNTVQATVANSKLGAGQKAAAMNIGATNDLTTKFVAVSAAGGLVGVGMGIGVNTIDTSVVTNVTDSSISAGKLAVTAAENRDITQTAVSAGVGGVAGNATVMVTNIGSEVSDKYGLTAAETVDQNGDAKTTTGVMKDEEQADISAAFTKTNEAAAAQNDLFAKIDTSKVLGDKAAITTKGADGNAKESKLELNSGVQTDDTKAGAQVNKGGLAAAQGVKVNVSNSALTAGTAEIKADAVTNADVTVGSANAGVTSIGSTVGVLDVKRNSGVNIVGGKIAADNLFIGSDQSGTAKLDVYQAAVSGNNLGLFYSGVHMHGKNDINILGAQLSGKNGLSITTNDTTSAALQTIGVSAALSKNANIFVVDGKNESESTITVDKDENNKNSELTSANGNVVITAKHGEDVIDVAAAITEAQEKMNAAQAAYDNAREDEKATKQEALDAAKSRVEELTEANSKLTKAEKNYTDAQVAYDAAKAAYNQAAEADKAAKMDALQEARNNLTEAEFDLQKTQQQAKIAGATEKATMTAKIIPVAVAGMGSGLGFNAMVEDKSHTIIDIKDNQQFKAKNHVDINAINNSVNKVSSVAVNAALGAAIGATGVQAKGNANSKLNIGNNNIFEAERVKLGAKANVVNDANIISVGAGYGSFMVNWATASAETNVEVKVGDNLYKTANVDIIGKSDITQRASAAGFVGGMYTSGTNLAKVNAKDVVNVEAGGNKADSNENTQNNKVNLTAEGVVNQLADTNGYGGAYVDLSPAAAITKSKIESETNAKLTGKWNVNTINVSAKHDNIVDLDTDAVKAAVVGLSGVWAFNNIKNNTNINLSAADITAYGDIGLKALNDISYRNKIWAGGYGVVAGNALIAADDISLNTNVNIGDKDDASKKAALTSKKGAINIGALTDGGTHDVTGRPLAAIKKDVVIKSAGAVAGSLAFSSDDVTINNTINVNADSVLETKGSINNASENNITLSAADRLNYSDEATADTQGGAVGAASTDMDVTMNRSNTINVAGKIDSNYDAVLDAGDSSVLNMILKSNAYNRTIAPLVAEPSLDYTSNQTNTIHLQQGSVVQSARDIELAATTGDTTIATQSQSWRWTDGGMTGNASIASTAYGDGTSVGNSNNTVKVDGTVVAGKNTDLTITITDENGGQDALINEIAANENKKGQIDPKVIDELNKAQAAYEKAAKEKEDAEQKVSKLNVELTKLEGSINSAAAKDADLQTAMNTAETAKDNADNTLNSQVEELYKKYNAGGTDTTIEEKRNWVESNKATMLSSDDLSAYISNAEAAKNAQNVYTNAKKIYDENHALITNGSAQRASKQNELATAKDEAAKYSDTTSKEYKNLAKLLQTYQDAQKAYDDADKKATGANAINTLVFGTGKNLGKNVDGTKSYIKITASDWYTESNGSPAENVELQDYAARLTNKLTEINEMIQQYAGTKIKDVYEAERTRIYSELQALGLAHYDEALKQYVVSNEQSTVPTVELKNITVTGGNVSIKGDKLNGSGNITANGNPNVTINNESSYYLKVKNITVDGEGGKVKFNNVSASETDNITINAKRGDLVNDAIGNNATVTINVSYKANASQKDGFTPNVGITGTISNPYGTVQIKNDASSIYVTSDGSIKGRSILLTAKGSVTQGYTDGIYNVGSDPSKAVSSDVIEKIQAGIVNSIADIDKSGKYYTAFSSVENLAKFLYYNGIGSTETEAQTIAQALTGQTQNEANGIYAGGAIYINAANINVNGTIQSGYDTFKLEMKPGEINSTIRSEGGAQLKDNSSYKRDDYLVSNESGPVYENGKFVYKIKAWYNPYTKEIFTEDIDQSGGGRIYLAGAIANTNSNGGKLLALDGGANIDIDASAKDIKLQIGKINADNVEGQITIVDTAAAKPTITVYKRSGNEKITINDIEQNSIKVTYDPQKQMYQFTNGETGQVITSYKHVRDSKWFGLDVDKTTTSSMKNDVDHITSTTTTNNGKQTLRNDVIDVGSVAGYDYIAAKGYEKDSAVDNVTVKTAQDVSSVKDKDTIYQITLDRHVDKNNTQESEKVVSKSKKGLLGLWGSKTTTTWTETSGSVSAYNYGIKADNPIEIGFIGNKSGSTVKITGAKDVTLAGDIRAGSVNVTAKNGSIVTSGFDSNAANQQKTIYTDKLNLNATNGNIKALQQGVDKALELTATADQNIDIKTLAGIKSGDVYLNNVNAGGNLTLSVEGKILTSNTSTYATREAGSAKLSAGGLLTINAAGGIGDKDNWIEVAGGKNANLKTENGNIYMRQLGNGPMSLEQVIAENGDVFLEAKGGFVDAIADNTVSTSNENAALADWKKLGLLGNDGVTDGLQNDKASQVENLTKQADNFYSFGTGENNALVSTGNALVEAVQTKYDDYMGKQNSMYTAQAKLNEAVSALNKSDTEANKSAYNNALAAYNKAFGAYAQAKSTYETAKRNWISENVGSLTTDIGLAKKAEGWLNSYETVQHSASSAHQWSARELMYAVQDSIINPKAGTITDIEKANVVGNNITLKTDGSFGVKDTQKTEIKIADMFKYNADGTLDSGATSEADLKKLAAARADDVTWGTDTIVIERTKPITVQLNKKVDNNGNESYGNVKLETLTNGKIVDNIYMIAKDSALNLEQVIASGDVRLLAHKGIYSSNANGDLRIIGKDITLEGGYGNIGSSTQAVLAGLLGGKINANAARDIYLKQMASAPTGIALPAGTTLNSNMLLGSLAAKNITINATGDIVSGLDKIIDDNGNTSEASGISYINASEKLTLKTTGGSVGTADSGLRVKNSGGVVEIDAQNGAYLEAKGDGTLILGTIKTGSNASDSFVVNSEGSLSVGREEVKDSEGNIVIYKVDGSIIVGADDAKANVKLTTANALTFSGKVRANELTTQSYAGDIKQTTKETTDNIEAEKLIVSAIAGDIDLANDNNLIKDISILAFGGSLNFVVSKADGLDLNLGSYDNALSNNYGGSFKIKNNAGDINVKSANTNIYGDIELTAKNNITIAAATETTKSILATNQKVTYGGGSTNEAMLQPNGNIKLTAETGSVRSNGTLNADSNGAEGAQADVIISAQEKVEGNGKIESLNGSVGIAAGSDIDLAEVIANNGKADIKSEHGDIYLRKVNGKDVILVTKDAAKQIKAEDVTAGSLTVNGNNVNVGLNYDADVRNDGYVDIIFASSDGSSMIDDITLNIDAGEIGKGAIIKQLWAKNANVRLAQGSLNIEKLAVENKAHFDVNGMTTSVWGVPPQRDSSNSSYWFNVGAWKQGGDWMNLLFSEKQGVQSSNGILLDLHNYFYAYEQRFTADDYMNQLLAENKADEYDINFNSEVVHYFRYDLYDLEQRSAENAAPEEVVIEA